MAFVFWIFTQLAQPRSDNVVKTSLLSLFTLSQRCNMVKNESCADIGLWKRRQNI